MGSGYKGVCCLSWRWRKEAETEIGRQIKLIFIINRGKFVINQEKGRNGVWSGGWWKHFPIKGNVGRRSAEARRKRRSQKQNPSENEHSDNFPFPFEVRFPGQYRHYRIVLVELALELEYVGGVWEDIAGCHFYILSWLNVVAWNWRSSTLLVLNLTSPGLGCEHWLMITIESNLILRVCHKIKLLLWFFHELFLFQWYLSIDIELKEKFLHFEYFERLRITCVQFRFFATLGEQEKFKECHFPDHHSSPSLN